MIFHIVKNITLTIQSLQILNSSWHCVNKNRG